jgi:hypothetical protein
MPRTAQDELYQHFATFWGQQAPDQNDAPSSAAETPVSLSDALTQIGLARGDGASGQDAVVDELMGLFRAGSPAASLENQDGISGQLAPDLEGILGFRQNLGPSLSDTLTQISQPQSSETRSDRGRGEDSTASLADATADIGPIQGGATATGSGSGETAADSDGGMGSMLAALSDEMTGISPPQDSAAQTGTSGGEDIAALLADATAGIGPLQDSAAPTGASGGEDFTAPLAGATAQMSPLESGATPAGSASGDAAAGSDGGMGSVLESIGTTVLESGFGLAGLIGGLVGLFEGGASAPAPLEKYAMPDRIYFDGDSTGGGIGDADYDQMGMPRAYSAAPGGTGTPAGETAAPGATGNATSSAPMPQITVNVQTMDAQSFMDYSNEFAQAVRYAMLNLNSINDAVNAL